MIPNIGPVEIAIIAVIALVILGSKRLPELGGALGKGIRGFAKGLKGEDEVPALDSATPPKEEVRT
jgi:sec-independent protein translocase protein TatA